MSDFLERLFTALNESKVPYIVTGAETVAVYGRVRTTRGRKEDKVYQLLDLLTHKEYDRLFGYSTT